MLIYLSTRDPFSKINPRAIPGPIIYVWLKICRNSSILRIRVILIKQSRNRNVKYKSSQYSVLLSLPNNVGRLIVFAPFLIMAVLKKMAPTCEKNFQIKKKKKI